MNNSFYACYALFGYESTDELLAAEYEIDSTAPTEGGCNGFPWFFFAREDPAPSGGTPPEDFVDGGDDT